MDLPDAKAAAEEALNSPEPVNGAPTQTNLSTSAAQATPSAPIQPSPWAPQNTIASTPSSAGPSFPQYSAATAEILKRLQANQGNATTQSAAFEAKRAEVLQNYVTSDKLPTPPPVAGNGRKGRGGRVGTPLKAEAGASSAGPTPASRGRGRGRGRGGGRGGKRKRADSVESDDDSDISSSYTPLPTRTKSGRNVNKPVAFVPTLPEPTQTVKRRRSVKTILAAQCRTCHRGTDPTNNRIVFCDSCSTAYHQYCHNPPISNEVVNVLEKEWLCGPCERSKQTVIEGTDGLTTAEGLSIDEKRAYFSTLPPSRLVSLLLHASIRHPELPIFPANVHELIPDQATSRAIPPKPPISKLAPPPSTAKPHNGHGSTGGTPRSQQLTKASGSDVDPSEAQLLGEIGTHQPSAMNPPPNQADYDDGYDSDPPASYPKAGNGLARTLRPESEDLQWLVDDNFEVFSHGWKGDGTGMGADGVLADAMEGVGSDKA